MVDDHKIVKKNKDILLQIWFNSQNKSSHRFFWV